MLREPQPTRRKISCSSVSLGHFRASFLLLVEIIRKWKRRDKRAKKEGGGGKKGEQDKKAQGKVPH
jgi:hypothetical protein